MHIDKYVVNNIGTKWTKGKDKKNQVLDTLDEVQVRSKQKWRVQPDCQILCVWYGESR